MLKMFLEYEDRIKELRSSETYILIMREFELVRKVFTQRFDQTSLRSCGLQDLEMWNWYIDSLGLELAVP